MPALIQDYLYAYGNDLTPIPLPSQKLYAVPSSSLMRISVSGTYRVLSDNPNIVNQAFTKGMVATTDINGQFSFSLPYGATETKPVNSPFTIVFPDNRYLSGIVPSVAGPISLSDLVDTYAWEWTEGITYIAPSSGVEARGSALFVGGISSNVIFTTPMASTSYQISFSSSVDSVTAGFTPGIFWSDKTTTGFVINTTTEFNGNVDWSAKLI